MIWCHRNLVASWMVGCRRVSEALLNGLMPQKFCGLLIGWMSQNFWAPLNDLMLQKLWSPLKWSNGAEILQPFKRSDAAVLNGWMSQKFCIPSKWLDAAEILTHWMSQKLCDTLNDNKWQKLKEVAENVGPFALVAIPSIKALPFWRAILSDPFLVVSSLSVIIMSTCLLRNDLTQASDTFWSHSTTLDNILSHFDTSKQLAFPWTLETNQCESAITINEVNRLAKYLGVCYFVNTVHVVVTKLYHVVYLCLLVPQIAVHWHLSNYHHHHHPGKLSLCRGRLQKYIYLAELGVINNPYMYVSKCISSLQVVQ